MQTAHPVNHPGPRQRFGTSSWSAKSWLGNFYATGTAPGDFLAAYAQVFNTVEADVTYYRTPNVSMLEGWRRRTPEGFIISAKMPRSIVHAGKGARPDASRLLVPEHVERETDEFLHNMARLGSRLGPLVLQFPYFNQQVFGERGLFLDRLEAYLAGLPRDFRFALEVRNRSWVDKELLGLLREHGVAFVLLDLAYMPHPADFSADLDLITADFVYTRLIGDRKQMDRLTQRFDRVVVDQSERLERWASFLQRVASDVPELFVYANNHYAGHGPATAAQIEALFHGRPVPGVPRVPRSGELPF